MEEVVVRFQHKVGSIIKHRLDGNSAFLVVERQMTQCTGGVQKYYVCQSRHFEIQRGSGHQLFKLNEIEVEAIEDGEDSSQNR